MDRTLGANKPVDPATRLSELLAQSLEELTRPFDPAHPHSAPARDTAQSQRSDEPVAPEQTPEESRIDADKALAELEAELFAAAKQVDRETPAEAAEAPAEHGEEAVAAPEPEGRAPSADHPEAVHMVGADAATDAEKPADAPNEADIAPAPLVPDAPAPQDEGAAAVIARVRKLMLVSMAVTIVAVGSVFGFIGYRIFKGEGTTAKTADKLPPASAIPTDITLSLPRGARVIQAAVAAERLVVTLETDGKVEVRTFDVRTLQPAGRINFSGTP
ncbi:MAG: hypothetical protein WCE79_27285 [Xanthobacteraceae bacterium]